jgi:pimeloyl-ACP methyl ester carboxylesterase
MDESRSAAAAERPALDLTTVVTVHGLWMHVGSMVVLQHRLESRSFRVRAFGYPSVTHTLEENAAALHEFIERVPGGTVHLLAHSLGGVLIRTMLEHSIPRRLGRVVMLGSPLRGSRIGARTARLPGGRRIVGRSIVDLNERGGFPDWVAGVPAGCIAGRLPLGAGWLVGGFLEANDGTVAVAETRVPGLADHVVLPVSHFALLWSKRVSQQAQYFLEHGRFLHRPR